MAERALVGRFGVHTEMSGGQRIEGMIIGLLLICEPPHQSITQIASALRVSKASVSTTVRRLMNACTVERVPVAGSRQHYYQMAGGGSWVEIVRSRWEHIQLARRLAEDGLALLGDDRDRRRRMEEYLDFLAFVESEIGPDLLDRWDNFRLKRIQERESSQ
ncbi:hypothetical protein [Stackebrandtia sp.]|jgi:DNA-binding transcriptional regulator GbsR (MarR family)|uniref:GbsR/MarR family transcriptional regulator n=1 Tax=Stackebrandtia sp. TaxID=2023065 RepID=UPI002D76F1E8|nr:hypothetical protein [Stackebrandtia sp.]